MALSSGARLGPYEILGPLGQGGMGEVYRARDTRLARDVAIKVLPSVFAADPERLRRFEQEAHAAAALNHPNILAVYDIGTHDHSPYIVSELLDGETLRRRLSEGALPVRKAIEYAVQIAQGLAAAHEKGIVHRDLKPENVFVTADGRVKVLDFGLAKLTDLQPAVAAASLLPTVPPDTLPGVVLGTVGYMSPEQVRGLPADQRSDIFSFGTILHEMLSGRRAFLRETTAETMTAILKEDPPELPVVDRHIPSGITLIINRCLDKNPVARFQSTRDLAFALEAVSGSSAAGSTVTPSLRIGRARQARPAAMMAMALLAALGVGALILSWRAGSPQQPSFRQLTFRPGYIRTARFAPDGRTIVFGGMVSGQPMQVYSDRTDTLELQPAGLPGADLLSISRTGEMAVALRRTFPLAWTPIGTLATAPIGGGAPRELLEDVVDADWAPDGSGIAVVRSVAGRVRLEYPIGHVLYETGGYISDIRFSRGGDRIAFLDHPIYGDDRGSVSFVDLKGARQVLTGEWTSEQGLAWSADGREIWFTAAKTVEPNVLRAVTLSGRQRTLMATPAHLHLEDVSTDGRVLISAESMKFQTLVGDTKTQHETDVTFFEWQNFSAVSRDGQTLLMNEFNTGGTDYKLYLYRLGSTGPVLIGVGGGADLSPDGRWALSILPSAPDKLLVIPTGVGAVRTLAAEGLRYRYAAWVPDGKSVLFAADRPGHRTAMYAQNVESGATRQIAPEGMRVPAVAAGALRPGVSPDGKFCLVADAENRYWRYPLDGSDRVEARGLRSDDYPANWHGDADHLFVTHRAGWDRVIDEIDIRNGERKPWLQVTTSDRTALIPSGYTAVTADGAHYVTLNTRVYSDIFEVEGIR